MTNSYGSDGRWHCPCGAGIRSACTCVETTREDVQVREALYARLAAQGIQLDVQGRTLPLETLAALLVAVEDPFWTEGDSARLDDANYMILLIKEGEGRPR